MKKNTAKIIISAIAAGLSAYFRVMAIPIVILVLVMIIDYITGMWKAWITAEEYTTITGQTYESEDNEGGGKTK